jgi:hypothetical protein
MHRQREWDASATVDAPGARGEESLLVVLSDGRALVEAGLGALDGTALARALRLEPPFRAHAVRQERLWSVVARRIEVIELADAPAGDDVELVWDGSERTVRIDGAPTLQGVAELERVGAARYAAYVVRARHLDGRSWEVEVSPL